SSATCACRRRPVPSREVRTLRSEPRLPGGLLVRGGGQLLRVRPLRPGAAVARPAVRVESSSGWSRESRTAVWYRLPGSPARDWRAPGGRPPGRTAAARPATRVGRVGVGRRQVTQPVVRGRTGGLLPEVGAGGVEGDGAEVVAEPALPTIPACPSAVSRGPAAAAGRPPAVGGMPGSL